MEAILETTIHSLVNDTERSFSKSRKGSSPSVRVRDLEIIPMVGDRLLRIKAKTESNGTPIYVTTIIFDDVDYVDEDERGAVELKAVDGSVIFINPISSSEQDVRVRCECLDFYWRFATWNHEKGSLDGPPPTPYIKKTERPPVNPKKTAGVCHHLMALSDALRGRGIVK